MGGEAKSPQYSMAHTTKLVPARVNFIFLTCVVFDTLLVSPDDGCLLSGSSFAISPCIVAIQDAGIPGVSDLRVHLSVVKNIEDHGSSKADPRAPGESGHQRTTKIGTSYDNYGLSNYRSNRVLHVQSDSLHNQIYAWKSPLWPLMPTWLMLVSLLLFACCLACASRSNYWPTYIDYGGNNYAWPILPPASFEGILCIFEAMVEYLY